MTNQIGDRMGIIFDIQRGSTQDGPGLRTTVFLKGCPLRCKWCHNPESWKFEPEDSLDRSKSYGRKVSVDEVMEIVLKDRKYYADGEGGVTVSGGEPAAQPEFTAALLKACERQGIHTCLDTSGCAPDAVFTELSQAADLVLFDLKTAGEDVSKELVGHRGDLMLRNLESALAKGVPVRLRCPFIPGVNDTDQFAGLIARYSVNPSVLGVDVMPYHRSGEWKFTALGMEVPSLPSHVPDEMEINDWKRRLAKYGAVKIV